MHEQRLLERIRTIEGEPLCRAGVNRRSGTESVLSHLQRILNTRQGNVPIAGDYGVPDLLDFLQTYPESVKKIEQSIKRAIDKFEPRLSDARVLYVPEQDPTLMLRFDIVARLRVEDGREIFFQSVIDSNGRVRINA
jgi:type VI secretion system protein